MQAEKLIAEAKWFGQKIQQMDGEEIFPMLNIGSSTDRFRTVVQGWIDEYIFKPIREKGLQVVHMDRKKAFGVDVVGDLNDRGFLRKLSTMRFQSVFCSNLFEHIRNREEIAEILTSLIPEGGTIFISSPHRYPFHADPIGTGFRPDVNELVALFPDTRILSGEVVTCGNYWDYITKSPIKFLKTVARLCVPFYKPMVWYSHVRHIPLVVQEFSGYLCGHTKEDQQRGLG